MRKLILSFPAASIRVFAASCWGITTTLLQIALSFWPPDKFLQTAVMASSVALAIIVVGLASLWLSEHYRRQTGWPQIPTQRNFPAADRKSLRYRIGEEPDVTRLELEIQDAYGPGHFSRKSFESRLLVFPCGFHVAESQGIVLGFMSLWPLRKDVYRDYLNGEVSDLAIDSHALAIAEPNESIGGWLCLSYLFRSREIFVADYLVYHSILSVHRLQSAGPIRIVMPADHEQDEGFLRRLGFQRLEGYLSFDGAPLFRYESLRDKSDLERILASLLDGLKKDGVSIS